MATLLFSAPCQSQESSAKYDIARIKAAFIYNFIEFVTWPDRAPGKPIVIGILGDDPFGNAFSQVEGHSILGRTLIIRKSRRIEDLSDSWILFISESERSRVIPILEQVKGKPVLTVSDMDAFISNGGMIQLYSTDVDGDTKVRFDINKEATDAARLKLSFRLLSLAKRKP